jgi:ubiquinone/menaquinone biosynthesis C-methylase UbiE
MDRVAEPELMDDAEQALAYALADFAEPHQAFVTYFHERFPTFEQGSVIDLGCGAADVTMRFARAYPHAKLIGLDGAEAMLAHGRQSLAQSDLGARVTLIKTHLPAALPFIPAVDAVISNSLLHHLAGPAVLWQTIRRLAKPGAPVLVMDLLRPHSIDEAERLVAIHTDAAPPVLRKDFFNSLLAAYQLEEIRQQLRDAGLDHFTVEQVSDRHLLAWGTMKG